MKQILIIRHAKSDWAMGLRDFERPLNARGHQNAPVMAQRLLDKEIKIDAFVSSTAKRALTTCKYFAEIFGVKEDKIIQVPELYHAPPSVFRNVISKLNNQYKSIALFAHNPGITEFVNELTVASIDNMPTCGIFAVSVDTDKWTDFESAKKTFLFFDYPKA